MASIGHLAVGAAFGRAFSKDDAVAKRAAALFCVVSMAPDLDSIGFLFRVPYESQWGHRGFTHSIFVALCVGVASFLFARWRALPVARTVIFTTLVALSHGLLDTLTYGGGLGCALLWPLDGERYWAPFRFIPVAPIGVHLFSPHGFYVIAVELFMFSPCVLYALRPRRG